MRRHLCFKCRASASAVSVCIRCYTALRDERDKLRNVIGEAASKCFGHGWTKEKIAWYLRSYL